MTSQTPEVDTTEIEDWKEEFWYKIAEWNNAQPEDIDIYANQLEILIEYHIKEQVHQQQQKHREAWLREEIVKLKNMEFKNGLMPLGFGKDPYNKTLQTIIDRYQKELDQDNKKKLSDASGMFDFPNAELDQAELEGGLVDKG